MKNKTYRVAIEKTSGTYPADAPFHPHEKYPEYGDRPISDSPNYTYEGVRRLLISLGLDIEHFGSKEWNPLGTLIKPGNRVFIKPNMLTHEYRVSCEGKGDLFAVITHPSVVRAVADYAAIALQGQGEIIIGDNPSIDADFNQILEKTGLKDFEDFYSTHWGISCRVLDLRSRVTKDLKYYGFKSKTTLQQGDPEGESIINLGRNSYLKGLNPLLFRGVFTRRWETIWHHHGSRHDYSISNTILSSDVFISVPKLKTHRKVGMTLNVKGLVGICANKNLLVHWRIGFPGMGGDEYHQAHSKADPIKLFISHLLEDLLRERVYLFFRDILSRSPRAIGLLEIKREHPCDHFRGAWRGNDTCWRMAADLYNLFVEDITGWREAKGRKIKFFTVVDGIIAGEGDGPFCPRAREANHLLGGEHFLAVDIVSARLIDFEYSKIPYLRALSRQHGIETENIKILGRHYPGDSFFEPGRRYLAFKSPSCWDGISIHYGGQQ